MVGRGYSISILCTDAKKTKYIAENVLKYWF